nr:MAG TPA: hypothetical protein [Caudoviricetes sp.]
MITNNLIILNFSIYRLIIRKRRSGFPSCVFLCHLGFVSVAYQYD